MKQLLYLKDDQLKELIEKLFISYRETFSDSKKILNKLDLGLLLKGSQEIKPGYKDYDSISDYLEAIDESL